MSVETKHKSIQEVMENLFNKPDYQNLVDALCNQIKTKGKDLLKNGVDVTNLVLLTDLAMREAGKLKVLVGYEKKALVITALRKLAQDMLKDLHDQAQEVSGKLEQDIKNLTHVMDTSLDSMVDQLFVLAPQAYGKAKDRCFSLKKFSCCH